MLHKNPDMLAYKNCEATRNVHTKQFITTAQPVAPKVSKMKRERERDDGQKAGRFTKKKNPRISME